MLVYKKIDISDGIDVDMSDKSKECMLSHYWHFLDKSFSYGPYLCGRCYNMMQNVINFKTLLLFILKKVHTEFVLYI